MYWPDLHLDPTIPWPSHDQITCSPLIIVWAFHLLALVIITLPELASLMQDVVTDSYNLRLWNKLSWSDIDYLLFSWDSKALLKFNRLSPCALTFGQTVIFSVCFCTIRHPMIISLCFCTIDLPYTLLICKSTLQTLWIWFSHEVGMLQMVFKYTWKSKWCPYLILNLK